MPYQQGRGGRRRGSNHNNNNNNGNGNGNNGNNGNNGRGNGGYRNNGNRNLDNNNNRQRNGDRNNGWSNNNNNNRGINKGNRYNNSSSSRGRGNSRGYNQKTSLSHYVLGSLGAVDAIDPKPFNELLDAATLAGGLLVDSLFEMGLNHREVARRLAVPLSVLLPLHNLTRMLLDGTRGPDAEGDYLMFDDEGQANYGQSITGLPRGGGQNAFSSTSINQIPLARLLTSSIGSSIVSSMGAGC
ncbi:hypothetical protein B0I37DRAFT_414149 [Chaetomium sp. MPI-CAGE-AT-0009]|nr:hypothetical protein B0I37DRAFT_414149 [Chaetomium sp. MPI-CAGE-AT-0009]